LRTAALEREERYDRLQIVLCPVLELAQHDLGALLCPHMLRRSLEGATLRLIAEKRDAENVRGGGQEGDVVFVERPGCVGIDLEHAPGAAVHHDGDVEKRDNAMLPQHSGDAELGIVRQVFDDHRPGGLDRAAGWRGAIDGKARVTDEAAPPAHPGDHKKIAAIGPVAQDLDVLDVRHARHLRGDVVHEPVRRQ
jgi:hypothetical protein